MIRVLSRTVQQSGTYMIIMQWSGPVWHQTHTRAKWETAGREPPAKQCLCRQVGSRHSILQPAGGTFGMRQTQLAPSHGNAQLEQQCI